MFLSTVNGGIMKENKINSNIHISITAEEEIKHITLLYGDPDRKLPEGVSVLDIIKDCLTEDEYKEYEEFWKPHKYDCLTDYLSEELGCSQPGNVCALVMDLARYNGMSMSELFSKFEG